LRATVFALAACVLIAGCERKQPPHTTEIAVEDDAARTVALPQRAQRIVSLMPTVTDLVIALGYADRLIARTDFDTDPRIANLPPIGGGLTPSVEWLAAQKPDLVISWPDNASRSLVGKIEAVGIPVYAARTEIVADALRTIRNLGVLLGATSSADSLALAISGSLDSTRASTSTLRPVRAVYVLSTTPPTIAGPGTFIDELIAIAGGYNVFTDIKRPWPEVSLEAILRRDPDVIVLARENESDPQQFLERIPGWRNLRAVRSGRVHRVSPNLFNRSGPYMPAAARELAQFFNEAR
jgi:iron complex transport system substrate-binding protein